MKKRYYIGWALMNVLGKDIIWLSAPARDFILNGYWWEITDLVDSPPELDEQWDNTDLTLKFSDLNLTINDIIGEIRKILTPLYNKDIFDKYGLLEQILKGDMMAWHEIKTMLARKWFKFYIVYKEYYGDDIVYTGVIPFEKILYLYPTKKIDLTVYHIMKIINGYPITYKSIYVNPDFWGENNRVGFLRLNLNDRYPDNSRLISGEKNMYILTWDYSEEGSPNMWDRVWRYVNVPEYAKKYIYALKYQYTDDTGIHYKYIMMKIPTSICKNATGWHEYLGYNPTAIGIELTDYDIELETETHWVRMRQYKKKDVSDILTETSGIINSFPTNKIFNINAIYYIENTDFNKYYYFNYKDKKFKDLLKSLAIVTGSKYWFHNNTLYFVPIDYIIRIQHISSQYFVNKLKYSYLDKTFYEFDMSPDFGDIEFDDLKYLWDEYTVKEWFKNYFANYFIKLEFAVPDEIGRTINIGDYIYIDNKKGGFLIKKHYNSNDNVWHLTTELIFGDRDNYVN